MAVTDRIAGGHPVDLPPEAGAIDNPRFEPNDAWLRRAAPEQQQTAAWRWFATRYDDPVVATPHDEAGHYLYEDGEPCRADQLLRKRFGTLIPSPVLEGLIAAIRSEVGNDWVAKRMDKFGG
jgi:hypothetical protein